MKNNIISEYMKYHTFSHHKNVVAVSVIRKWQKIRDEQYTAIFNSIDDFSYQTMIKKALSLLIKGTKRRCVFLFSYRARKIKDYIGV